MIRSFVFALLSIGVVVHAAPPPALEDAPPPPPVKVATIHPALHLVGDSTVADKPLDPPNPERGWGQLLPTLLKEPARVVNHAINGRSTKSFRDEGHWRNVLAQLQPGDFVLIEFGHNDQKAYDPRRYAAAETDYKDNLRRFVREVREKGADALIAPPIFRRKFENGVLLETHGAYPDAARAVAAELNVPLIDLHKLSRPLLENLGPEDSKQLFVWVKPGEYARYPKGREDDTHFNEKGALAIASIVAEQLRLQKHPIADWLK